MAARRYVFAPTADPRKPPPVPPDVEQHLSNLEGLHPDTRAYLKFLFPDAATESEAQRLDRERDQAVRVEHLRTLSELTRAALAGNYGAVTRSAVRQVLADKSIDRAEQLEQCGRIIEQQRAEEAKANQTPRGRYAP